MAEEAQDRFQIVVQEGPPGGGLYELEIKTYYQVVDRRSNQIVMVLESLMEASLSTSTGLWDDYRFSGVSGVTVAPDGRSLLVEYHDGLVETVLLPD